MDSQPAEQNSYPEKRPAPLLKVIVAVVLTAIALGIVWVIGSILIKASRNHGLMPMPTPLARYECRGPNADFALLYLHGTERVTIQSKAGALDGKVYQNRFEWGAAGKIPGLLGFMPPDEIVFEDAQSLRIAGPSFTGLVCTNVEQTSGHRRAIAE